MLRPLSATPRRRRDDPLLRLATVAAGLALVGLAAGCVATLGPEPLDLPVLRTLGISSLQTNLRHGGLLYIFARPADRSFRLHHEHRVPVEIAVSSGDRERVGLYRQHCPARERGVGFPCFEFTVHMAPGHHAASLADRVAAIGGRFRIMPLNGSFAGVTMFYPDIMETARRAESWPGVASVASYGVFCPPDSPGCTSPSDLLLPVPVDTGAAVAGDGIVQVRSHDTVTVTYRQPTGDAITARIHAP